MEGQTTFDAGTVGHPDPSGATLLVGGSGSLGSLVAAALLADAGRRLVMPMRSSVDPVAYRAGIGRALVERGLAGAGVEAALQRLVLLDLPAPDRLADLDAIVSSLGIDELVNCAGSIDYYDSDRLRSSNIELTGRLLQAARRWRVRRFIHLSTAYCSGYRDGLIPERLHPDLSPADDPTEYTRTKRIAEWMVADSGVPFVIVRPSIVIGESQTGRYTGKPSGLYQMLRGIEGLLCSEYLPIWHMVAPPSRLNFVHQDAFQSGFLGIYRGVAPNAIVHLTGDHEQSPTMRDLVRWWADQCWPREIHLYASIEDVPLRTIPRRQRHFLELAAVNFEIATRPWHFETTTLDRLRANGVPFVDATLASVARCQQRFVEESARIQAYQRTYQECRGAATRLVELYDRTRWSDGGVAAAAAGARTRTDAR